MARTVPWQVVCCLLDLFFEHAAFSDLMRIMWYRCRCKSCSELRQITALCKVQRSAKTISFLPALQQPWTLQKQRRTLVEKIAQRRMRQCSSCCTVGKVCIMIDSSDSSATLLPHRICSLHFAVSSSESLPQAFRGTI